jgi:hypothetical protein
LIDAFTQWAELVQAGRLERALEVEAVEVKIPY